jgi:hypothetical protein
MIYFSLNPKPITIIIILHLKSIFPTTKYKSQAFSIVPNINNNKRHFQESKHCLFSLLYLHGENIIALFLFASLFTRAQHFFNFSKVTKISHQN